MGQPEPSRVRRPRADDRLMRDVLFGISGYPAVLIAHDLKLYPLLAERPRTLPEVCDALHIAPRAAEALVSVSTALGLLEERDGRSLTSFEGSLQADYHSRHRLGLGTSAELSAGYRAPPAATTVLRSETPQHITASRAPGDIGPVVSEQYLPHRLRPREIGRVETRAEQSLGSADALKGSHDVQRERDEPIVIDVGQLALGLRPHELIRIEFRGVARKAVHIHAGMSLEKGPHVPMPMNLPAIPQQDKWSTEMAE